MWHFCISLEFLILISVSDIFKPQPECNFCHYCNSKKLLWTKTKKKRRREKGKLSQIVGKVIMYSAYRRIYFSFSSSPVSGAHPLQPFPTCSQFIFFRMRYVHRKFMQTEYNFLHFLDILVKCEKRKTYFKISFPLIVSHIGTRVTMTLGKSPFLYSWIPFG